MGAGFLLAGIAVTALAAAAGPDRPTAQNPIARLGVTPASELVADHRHPTDRAARRRRLTDLTGGSRSARCRPRPRVRPVACSLRSSVRMTIAPRRKRPPPMTTTGPDTGTENGGRPRLAPRPLWRPTGRPQGSRRLRPARRGRRPVRAHRAAVDPRTDHRSGGPGDARRRLRPAGAGRPRPDPAAGAGAAAGAGGTGRSLARPAGRGTPRAAGRGRAGRPGARTGHRPEVHPAAGPVRAAAAARPR